MADVSQIRSDSAQLIDRGVKNGGGESVVEYTEKKKMYNCSTDISPKKVHGTSMQEHGPFFRSDSVRPTSPGLIPTRLLPWTFRDSATMISFGI